MIIKLNENIQLVNANSIDYLKTLEENSIDAIVTDPPAGINLMNQEWDSFGKPENKRYAYINFMKAIAKECLRVIKYGGHALVWALPKTSHWTAIAWEDAGWEVRDRIVHCFGSGLPKNVNIEKITGSNKWKGWGTALKPSVEDWWLLRKPLEKGLSITENVLKWGTGALNIDACKIGNEKIMAHHTKAGTFAGGEPRKSYTNYYYNTGRFPANLIIDDSEEVLNLFPHNRHRFFYCAKASRKEKDLGLTKHNNHPTVKPIALMEYLIKLICPENGIVLDCFMGSGSTGIACVNLNKRFIGIEINKDYFDMAKQRIEYAIQEKQRK